MKLVIKEKDKKPREIELERKAYVIGRDSVCDIMLSDNRVSSRHLFLTPRGKEWWIRDLGSTNGTFINGRQVSVSPIREGDVVKIGHTMITLGEPPSSIPRASSPTQLTTRVEIVPSPPSTLEEAKKVHRHLEVLCEVSRVLNSLLTVAVEEALQKTTDLIFQVLRADRGVIFLEDKGALKITAERRRTDDVSPLQISRSIVDEVFKGNESVLTSDAMEDTRFRNRASVVSSHIHSAMCVPLKGKEKNLGVIYVDTLLSKGAFQEEDLELLTVIGHQAGMAIENAHLYEENLRREKLAGIGMAIAGMAHYVKNIIQGLKGGGTLVD
ncbi:MAG: FHA domain-containing protein, partial [Caldiserica bacterium]|nr:FHA domain-containing protein [Caldisericota bacterium]